jgi:hypothetical protein
MIETAFTAIGMCALLAATNARAADLEKIDRHIAREPRYESRSPRYCLLVFGPEAQARVWLVRDGDWLYVDHNGNGDLTEAGKRFSVKPSHGTVLFPYQISEWPLVEIIINEKNWGKLELNELKLHPKFEPADDDERTILECFKKLDGGIRCMLEVTELSPSMHGPHKPLAPKIRQTAGVDTWGSLSFSRRPQEAPILHFDGPLTLDVSMAAPTLERGVEQIDLQIMVGTRGLGQGSFASLAHYHYDADGAVKNIIPENLFPVVEAELPSRSPGGEPVRAKWILRKRC